MATVTLSSVLDKQIRSLCLKDFPCGCGTWVKDEGRDGAEKEEKESLRDLLTCPMSPWRQEGSWSPQVSTLRELCVGGPEGRPDDTVHTHFITLRIVDKGVSVVDEDLLRFSSLRELVLSANSISDLHSGSLPSALRVLELYSNQVSDLKGLSCHPRPSLQHLGLGANRLGSPADVQLLTGAFWPQLVSLDLSWSDFQGHRIMVEALATLPCLRTLVLQGNPLTLTPSFPGFTLDSLPRLLYLDAARVTPDDRHRFRGLANMRDMILDQAVVMVTVGKMRGVPDPLIGQCDNAPEFPVVTYTYSVNYEFLNRQPSAADVQQVSVEGASLADAAPGSAEERPDAPKPDHVISTTGSAGNPHRRSHSVVKHSTPKLVWAETMDFCHTGVHGVADLGLLKSFLLGGLSLTVEEEKVLSWPAPDLNLIPGPKPNPDKKGGKDCVGPVSKTGSVPKSKDKKKKESTADLIPDAPIRRALGSVHVPLQDLSMGGHRVTVLCDLGVQQTEHGVRTTASREKESSKKTKDEKKKEEKKGKAADQKSATAPKGKGKGRKESEMDVHAEDAVSNQPEPMSVEFTVQLEKWLSTSDAQQPLHNLVLTG
ncbi:leucine-rich repeat-containing protein 43-like [Hypomesus transpacificus]|uniref:leucine-rich repeat-containing protein 43-like n=1 Tax=Hypomesus transpacificus TaxID=137520 RepID=UPI001F07353F|nr:leucine-rich repeat-containing protein 43-like [Hypomesus transpacificus]